jgi:predicted DNA binding CopG/RHH family protein
LPITFAQFLADAAEKGEAVNTLFEERLFDLVGILHKITDALASENIPYELIGGLAVLIHVEEANPEHSTLTRDVDLMVRRADLERIKDVAAKHGFRFRHSAGLDMLLYGETNSARNAVHLIFSGEKVRPNQATPNPPIRPVRKAIHAQDVFVMPVADLLRMKLSAYRDKDRVHIRSMDAAGLITAGIEKTLPTELQSRLQHVRATE